MLSHRWRPLARVLPSHGPGNRACGRPVPYSVVGRRTGDVAACWADAGRARQLLNWTADRTVEQMCADGWRWQQANPDGYRLADP